MQKTASQPLTYLESGGSPVNGATFQIVDNPSVLVWLTPASTLATLTVTLPTNGGTVLLGSKQEITSLTLNGASTIYNAPGTILAGELFALRRVEPGVWARVI